MNIVYTFDDAYYSIAAVSILSLLENNKSSSRINIFIVDCGIKKEHLNKINEMVSAYSRDMFVVSGDNMENKIPIKLELGYWSFVCYVRLFFCELFPELNRVLHIDCDTLILGDISSIYNIDMKKNLCAACYDCIPNTRYSGGFNGKDKYYSNGLLLFDLKRMREENTQKKFVDFIVEKNGKLAHLDQDVINAVLHDKILTLPMEYNVMTYTLVFKNKARQLFEKNEPYYSAEEIEHGLMQPKMIHFVGFRFFSKPWSQPCYHPYNGEWKKYYHKCQHFINDKLILLNPKKKKYGLLREWSCIIWNWGYKYKIANAIELILERRRLRKKCK